MTCLNIFISMIWSHLAVLQPSRNVYKYRSLIHVLKPTVLWLDPVCDLRVLPGVRLGGRVRDGFTIVIVSWFIYNLLLLGQWLNFKLFGITYLVGKI